MTTTPEPPKPPAPLDDLYKKFLSSPHHAAMGLLTLGVGILSGMPLVLIAGGVAYALGWIYLPGMPLFTKWIKKWEEEARLAEEQRQIDAFNVRRSAILSSLSAEQQQRYVTLASVCHDIEKAGAERRLVSGGAEEADPRLRKLDDLMWTFLRLLSFSQSLEQYLALEEREDLSRQLETASADIASVQSELEAKKAANAPDLEAIQRLLDSRTELYDVLDKRCQRVSQARSNLALANSELGRLEQQIKLIRADAVARKNADALSARIDATVGNLEQTNQWLAEIDSFKDLDAGIPPTSQRLGFAPVAAPAAPAAETAKPIPPLPKTNLRSR